MELMMVLLVSPHIPAREIHIVLLRHQVLVDVIVKCLALQVSVEPKILERLHLELKRVEHVLVNHLVVEHDRNLLLLLYPLNRKILRDQYRHRTELTQQVSHHIEVIRVHSRVVVPEHHQLATIVKPDLQDLLLSTITLHLRVSQVRKRIRVDVITNHALSLLLSQQLLILLLQNRTNLTLKFLQHKCYIWTLKLLTQVLINQLVNLLKLRKRDQTLQLNQMLRKFSENRVESVNQLNDLSIFTFKQTKEVLDNPE